MTRLSTVIENQVIAGPHLRHTFLPRLGEVMPPGWFVRNSVAAIPDVAAGDGSFLLFASAAAPTGEAVGVKISADQAADSDAVAAELAHELAEKIARWVDARPGSAIRFSLVENGRAPTRGSDGASGYDLYASQAKRFRPGEIAVVEVGIVVEIPAGFEGQVRSRSSMSKRGLWASLGTVDSDYRGIVGATLRNMTREDQDVAIGDRVAQLVITPVEHRPWVEVDRSQLSATARGDRGFGSTGK